jgi:hypothetical protein
MSARTQIDTERRAWFQTTLVLYLIAMSGVALGFLGQLGLQKELYTGLWPLLIGPAPFLLVITAMRFRLRAHEMPQILDAVLEREDSTPEDSTFEDLDGDWREHRGQAGGPPPGAPRPRPVPEPEPTMMPHEARRFGLYHIVIGLSAIIVLPSVELLAAALQILISVF